uniref:START domain-containing protein n=1 Tax=Elaeophora elaphi TaxID=1147741 RepID=A0A0R3RZT6_9BILA
MTISITVAGVTDTLKPEHEKFEKALNDAADAMNETLSVINTPEFETMEGWKLKNENKIDKIYAKRFAIGKIFTLRTTLDVPREVLFHEHWDNFEEVAYKNKNTSLAEKIAILTPHVEIIHYAMKDSGLVKGRDFVTTRIYRHIDGDIIEAARSYDTDEVKQHKKKTRGTLLLGSGRFRIHPKDPQKTIVDYIICLNFNGPDLTKPVVESVLSKLILQDAEYARETVEEMKNQTCVTK